MRECFRLKHKIAHFFCSKFDKNTQQHTEEQMAQSDNNYIYELSLKNEIYLNTQSWQSK